MSKIAHIFDLDNTLWSIDRGIWIINKDDPTKPLLKISESEFALIESGIYKNQGFKIKFSGKTYWLPKTLNERLKKTVKRYDANMHKLGISLQEYLNEDIIEHLKFDLKLENIEHLKNVTEDIFIVTSKTTKDKYKKMVRKLENKLEEEGLKIKGFFYINETFYNQRDDVNSYKKSLILLRFLTGQKIVKDELTSEMVDEQYDMVNFYDSSISSVESAKNVQGILDKVYLDTGDKQAKRLLRERVESIDLKLKVVQVTTNRMNPFIESEVTLRGPRQIMKFESFKISEGMELKRDRNINYLDTKKWMADKKFKSTNIKVMGDILKSVYSPVGHWGKKDHWGVVNLPWELTGWSILNKINTNYSALLILLNRLNRKLTPSVDLVNTQFGTDEWYEGYHRLMDLAKKHADVIFLKLDDKDGSGILNKMIAVMQKTTKSGDEGERVVAEYLPKLNKDITNIRIPESGGVSSDMVGGVDIFFDYSGKRYTVQVKKGSIKQVSGGYETVGVSVSKKYRTTYYAILDRTELFFFKNIMDKIELIDNGEIFFDDSLLARKFKLSQ